MDHGLIKDLPDTILQVLDHPPITIQISGKRTQNQAMDDSDEEIDKLEEETQTIVAPAKKGRQGRKKRVVPPDAYIENVQPPNEPTPTCSLSPLSPSPPKNTRGKNARVAKARRGRGKGGK
jgi:hypothetical protein